MAQTDTSEQAPGMGASELAAWLLQQGLKGTPQLELLEGYCNRLVEMGIPLFRIQVAQSAFHPKYGGITFVWRADGGIQVQRFERGSSSEDGWRNSPFYHIITNNLGELRARLTDDSDNRFPIFGELREQGATEYFALGIGMSIADRQMHFDPESSRDVAMVSWASNGARGFSDDQIDMIRASLPHLGLALKSASNLKMAQELMGIYLGQDAGQRVLSGEFERGSLQKINAAIFYFDLTGFTHLSESVPGDDLILMLNAYFGIAVAAVRDLGGHVLKFMGDGMLAMFDKGGAATASSAALDAASLLRQQFVQVNADRRQQGLPCTGCTLALHAGEILCGNIGAEERLDFTVIGPAVNLTARLSGLHRSVGQSIIVSEDIVKQAGDTGHDLVSLGRYMVRGVAEPKELFTIYQKGAT